MILNNQNINEIYNQILKKIKNDFLENQIFYEKYILDTKILKLQNNIVYILVKNDFVRTILNDKIDLFKKKFEETLSLNLQVKFIIDESEIISEEILNNNLNDNKGLISNLTFENLIIGSHNEKAILASKMLIDGTNNWNLLFFYGGTGLGKTHLLNAIGNEFIKKKMKLNIKYLQTEEFNRDVYNAISISGKKVEEYKDSFNDTDVLLVDDVQFLSNKNKMNEIFFSIFNRLINKNKYIVISSDKLPNTLLIDDRMISRLNSGLSLKINNPDLETIKKIIRKKINSLFNNFFLSDDIVEYLALNFNSDIRVLEGILNKIFFYYELEKNENISIESIKKILNLDNNFQIIANKNFINPELIIENVCALYNVDVKNIISKKRNKEYTFIRKICMFILREKTNLSLSEIGSYFSNRNHATVIESIKDIEEKIKKDKVLNNFINNFINKY